MASQSGLQFTAHFPDLPDGLLGVVAFTLKDRLSEPFSLDLELASQDDGLRAADVLDGPAMLVIWRHGEPIREVRGIVSAFRRGDAGHHRRRYHMEVRPPLWRLNPLRNSRIFQEEGAQEIIRTLLEERGIQDMVFRLNDDPTPYPYCVQHRETDLEFIGRLAAENGFCYRFDHDQQRSAVVFEADGRPQGPELGPIAYKPSSGGAAEQPHIQTFRRGHNLAEARVALKDYDFERPDYAFFHEYAGEAPAQSDDYSHYDQPGRFLSDDEGEQRARARLESLRRNAYLSYGKGDVVELMPGAVFELDSDGNAEESDEPGWRVVSVTHHGKQPQVLGEEAGGEGMHYDNHFEAIPANQNWRPEVPERPFRPGTQVAIVAGPEGEAVHCDEYGRVQVRFPWDRHGDARERVGAWLRVSQDWAGPGYGVNALPRVGDEVLVSFIDGDPDRPVVTGRTYHGLNKPPYKLPEFKTRSVWRSQTINGDGYNELTFDDEAEAERILLHAQRDLVLFTGNDRTEHIGNDAHLSVGNNSHSHIEGDDHLSITGEQRHQVGGDLSHDIGGDYQQQTTDALLADAGQEIHYKAGNKVVIDAGTELTLDAGGSLFKLDPSGVTLMGPTLKLNSGGAPGEGSGVALNEPEAPKSFEPKAPDRIEAPELEEVATRPEPPKPDPEIQLAELRKGGATCPVCESSEEEEGAS